MNIQAEIFTLSFFSSDTAAVLASGIPGRPCVKQEEIQLSRGFASTAQSGKIQCMCMNSKIMIFFITTHNRIEKTFSKIGK
jgi:hypothetical protein